MKKRGVFTKVLAIAGTILTGLPILATPLLSIIVSNISRQFRIDYLIPAELFPVALAGGLLLLWAAILSWSQVKCVAWALGSCLAALFLSQGLAVVTGLASGRIEAQGIWWILVLSLIAVYSICLVLLTICGIQLIRFLYKSKALPHTSKMTE